MAEFQSISLDTLPKRLVRGRAFDQETADALLAIVSQPGQAASDGTAFPDQDEARKAAGKARRLLIRVAPDPELVKSRVYAVDSKWHWALSIGTERPAKRGKSK